MTLKLPAFLLRTRQRKARLARRSSKLQRVGKEARKEERKDPTFTAKCVTADRISQALTLLLDKESLIL